MIVGIDLGSRTIKVAAVEDGKLVDSRIAESGYEPHLQALAMVKPYHPERIVATGYGRHLAQRHFAQEAITEIRAHALGARYFFPEARTVLDVGGQDSKVIALDETGRVANFQMNDRCAAGTGRFLEIMAASLGYTLDEFGPAALGATAEAKISSMCTVFAESEVISMKNHGTPPADIARAVHLSVVDRLVGMLHRVGVTGEIVFSGGVARNPAIARFVGEKLETTPLIPPQPDIVGALGAALSASLVAAPSEQNG